MSRLRLPVFSYRKDYGSNNVTTATWVNIISSLTTRTSGLEIYDSSGRVIQISIGASGDEGNQILPFRIVPGGMPTASLIQLSEGARLSIKAEDADATSGQLIINFFL